MNNVHTAAIFPYDMCKTAINWWAMAEAAADKTSCLEMSL